MEAADRVLREIAKNSAKEMFAVSFVKGSLSSAADTG